MAFSLSLRGKRQTRRGNSGFTCDFFRLPKGVKAIVRGQSRHPESSEKGCSWASRVSLKLPFPRQAEGKGHREHSQGALKQPFPRQARGKGNRKGLKLVSRIVRKGAVLGLPREP